MIGYLAVLFQRNDVADGEAVSHKIAGALVVENVVEVFKDSAGIIVRVHLTGINGFIVGRVRRCGQTAEVGKTQLHRRVPAQLIDRHRIGGAVQKALFHITGRDMAFDRIPIRLCDPEHSVMLDDILGLKNHFFGVVGMEHINRDVMLQQLQRPVFGKREHIAVQIPIAAHIVHRQRGVRHRDGLFQLREHIICRIGGNSDCAGDLFPSTEGQLVCLLQVFQQLQRRKADRRSTANVVELANFKSRCGQLLFGAVEYAAIQHFCGTGVIDGVINACVAALNVNVFVVVHHVELFRLWRFHAWLLRSGQILPVYAALLANLRKVPVNVRNQLGSRLVDGFQTGAKLFQLLAL